jgi:ACS family hexuronate transporter-like MFS transporter
MLRRMIRLRWYVCALLFLVTAINYIDRVSLGAMWDGSLKPALGATDSDYAWLQFWFGLAYALMFAFAGRLIDRLGVRTGLALGAAVWSLAAMGHALASSVVGFAVARFALGLGESTNFPAAIKAVAEWFPRRERALATGVLNMGTNVGAMLMGVIAMMAVDWGWRSVFVAFGVLGLAWLVLWLRFYRPMEEHPRLSAAEAAEIRADQEPAVAAQSSPWPSLLRYREAWAFCLGKMLTDPVWWFYLYWAVPVYLKRHQHLDLKAAAGSMAVIYLCADVGSVLGGWLPGRLQRAGFAASAARRTTMLLFAAVMPVALALGHVRSTWAAVAILCLATAAHQGWSANMFTVASDAFPRRAVGSVVGFGAMCGGLGGLFMPLVAAAVLQTTGGFGPLFILCGLLHPAAFVLIRGLTGRALEPVDLDRGLRTGESPALLAAGLALTLTGTAGAFVVVQRWDALVAMMQGDAAAAAGVTTVVAMVGLIGLALAYASREQRT